MSVAVVFTLLVSLFHSPVLLLTIDDSHAVGFENEHGISRMIFFHSVQQTDIATDLVAMFPAEERHEFHLTASTVWIKEKPHTIPIAKEISGPLNCIVRPSAAIIDSATDFEADISAVYSPPTVLRI